MSAKKTTEDFIIQSKSLNGEKYDYSMVNYLNNYTKVKIGCHIHGFFDVRPNDHLSKNVGCNKCNNAGISKSKNLKNVILNRFNKKHDFKYDYSLTTYEGTETKIKIICPIHGIFEQTPHHHLSGRGCQKCGKTKKLTTEEFIFKSKIVNRDKYDYSLVEYKNYRTKVKIICQTHGIFEVTPNDHINKQSGCPLCKESKGEKIIRKFLIDNNIQFIPQKRFKYCRDKKLLPFDFFLYEKNICIEYDGEQHFINRPTFGGTNKLSSIKRKDKIKDIFCKENNIFLVRINYKEDVIEKLKTFILNK